MWCAHSVYRLYLNIRTNAYTRWITVKQLQSSFNWGKWEEGRITPERVTEKLCVRQKRTRTNNKNWNKTATGSTHSCCNALSIMEDDKVLRQNFFSSGTRTTGGVWWYKTRTWGPLPNSPAVFHHKCAFIPKLIWFLWKGKNIRTTPSDSPTSLH